MFQIDTPLPTALEAFETLVGTIQDLDWFIANNRSNRLTFYQNLKNPLIDTLIEQRHLSKEFLFETHFEFFKKTLYVPVTYQRLIHTIQTTILPNVQACFNRIKSLQESFGFEILPRYEINLGIPGMGGSYERDNQNTGHIIIRLKDELPEQLDFLIVHELLHLGIEDLIINPQKLQNPPIEQEEKERIVDNLCIYAMKDIIPYSYTHKDGTVNQYQPIACHCAYMDNVVGIQPRTDLRKAVKTFLKEKQTTNLTGKSK